MGKISPVSAKYIVHTNIQIEGVVDRPDIIGAVFGQTEGLLGADLELRELQRSGRIGRIEVNTDVKTGKTAGVITIPSSLDKSETAIIAAAMETIQRIGPCNAKVRCEKIEDVRISKRTYVIDRAKELLRTLTEDILPDSQEITEEVEKSVRMMGISEYGKDKLPAGPSIDDSEEILIVEGRADVLNLLKHGFKNSVAMNGTSVPKTIIELCSTKVVTVFVDGDRGGDLIIRELAGVAEIDFVVKAPDGKEVEEITKKEIHKALRGKVTAEQAKMDLKDSGPKKNSYIKKPVFQQRERQPYQKRAPVRQSKESLTVDKKKKFKELLDDLVGTRGAYILDPSMNILGKVPATELPTTIRSLKGIYAIVFDGAVTKDLTGLAERANVRVIIGMDSKIKPTETRVMIMTSSSF
ncbi:DNA primase [archaeon]|jgi:DNA primase|nr:DNA primase [archaeon]MBT4397736.1 DNA primase [archaeon]MBT4441221.1 DNA primase [archaeon]